jgi:polyribonucleotide nucleotidyltransferase
MQFGLDIIVQHLGSDNHYSHGHGVGGGLMDKAQVAQERRSSPDELTFQIPRANVGGIIGKGGQALKDLQVRARVRVKVRVKATTSG